MIIMIYLNKTKKKLIILIGASIFFIVTGLIFYFINNNTPSKIHSINTEEGIKYYTGVKNIDIVMKPIIFGTVKNNQIINSANQTARATTLKGFSETIPILMYHYIEVAPASSTLKGLYLDPKVFASQLEELNKNNYQTLFVSEAAINIENKNALSDKNVVLTFDDGYEDFYTQAFPLIKKYNVKTTLYIIINALGTKGYLTRAQVRELADSGLVEIGSHTFNHPDLRNLKNKDVKFEIESSKKILETITGKTVLTFCYPFGLYKPEFFKLTSEAQYLTAVSTIPGTRQGEDNIWILRRIRPNDRSGQVFINWLKEWEKSVY